MFQQVWQKVILFCFGDSIQHAAGGQRDGEVAPHCCRRGA